MNSLKEINIKNRKKYFFDDMINMKSLGLNNFKRDEKSYKNILLYWIRDNQRS